MKVPLPPRIPSVILEEFEEDTIQELADTMEPGVVFSTEDHTYVLTKTGLGTHWYNWKRLLQNEKRIRK